MKKYIRIDINDNDWSGSTYTTTANLNINYVTNYGVAISKIKIKIAHTITNYSNSETGNQIRVFHKDTKPVGNAQSDIFFKGIIVKRTIIDNIIHIEADDYLLKTQDKIGVTNYEDSSGTNIKTIIQELCTLSGLTYDMSAVVSTPETILKFDTTNQQCFGRISYLLGLINWYWYFDPVLDDAVFRPRSALTLQTFAFASSGRTTNIIELPEWVDDSGDVVNDMIAVGGASETTIENESHTYGETDHSIWSNGDTYLLDNAYQDMTITSVTIESNPELNPEDYSTVNDQSPDGTNIYFPNDTKPTSGQSFVVSYLFNKKSKSQTANNSTSITQYGEKEKVINDRKVVDAGDLTNLVSNLVGNLFWGKATEEVRIKINESSIVPILGSMAAVYDGIRGKSLVWNAGTTECIVMAISNSWPGAGGDTTTISTKSMKDPYQSSHIEDRYDGLAREVSEVNPTELYKLTGEKALSGTMDCGHNQLINFRVHNVATTGLLGYEADGQLQFNTVDDKLYCYDGSTWIDIMGSSASITDHGTLTGLGDDDHSQYLLTNGSRACTGTFYINDTLPELHFEKSAVTKGGLYVDASDNFILSAEAGKLILGTWTGQGVVEIEPKNAGVVATFDSTIINYSVPFNMNYNKIGTLATPISDYDAATKKYVDDNTVIDHSLLSNLNWSTAGHILNASMVPTVDNTYHLGSSTYGWNNLYIHDIYSNTSEILIHDDIVPYNNNAYDLGSSSDGFDKLYIYSLNTTNSNGEIDISCDLVPETNDTYSLGSAAYVYKELFTKILSSDNSDIITVHCDLNPINNITYDLGDSTHAWLNVYLEHLYPGTASNITVHTDFVPNIDNAHHLGSSTYGWNNLYIHDIYSNSSEILIHDDIVPYNNNAYDLGSSSDGFDKLYIYSLNTTNSNGEIDISCDLVPETNDTYNLGSAAYAYDELFIKRLGSDNSDIITVHCDLNPVNNITYDLGNSTHAWLNVYLEHLYPGTASNITLHTEINMNTNKIIGLANPTSNQDAATKYYVDNAGGGDHGALTGLGDNDHTQYLLRTGGSGCRMSGDLEINRIEPGVSLWESSSLRGAMYIDASDNFILAGEIGKLILGTWTGAGVIEIEPKNAGVVATFDSDRVTIENITFNGTRIQEELTNSNSVISINKYGYDGGVTQFRDLFIDDGKDAHCIFVDGSSKKTWFYGDVAVNNIVEHTANVGVTIEGLDIKNSYFKIASNSIWQNTSDTDDAAIYINHNGYLDGITRFRDLYIRNGKRKNIVFFDGSTKESTFYGNVNMNDNDIIGCNIVKATTSQDLTFQITSGRAIIWQTV